MKTKLIAIFILLNFALTIIIKNNIIENGLVIYAVPLAFSFFMYLISLKIFSEPLNKYNRTLIEISNGNIVKKLDTTDNKLLEEIAVNTNKILENNKRLIGDVIASSQKTIIYSESLKNHAEVSSNASQEVALAVSEIAAGAANQLEYLTKIKENTSDMIKSSTLISNHSTKALESSLDMGKIIDSNQITINELITKMRENSEKGINRTSRIKELEAEIKEISKIISTVTAISEQTNLLALNASIEAARAGDAGKGFTVVADEVKKLAAQSATSTQEISNIIGQIVKSIFGFVKEMEEENYELKESITLADKAKVSFSQIVTSSENTIGAVESINNNTSAGVRNAKKIDDFIDQILQIIEQSSSSTEETSAASEEQSASMEEIFDSIKDLKTMTQDIYDKAEGYLNQYKFDLDTKNKIDRGIQLLKELSVLPEISTMDWDISSPVLVENINKHKLFHFLGVMDNNGIFHGSNDTDLKGQDFSHREYFKDAMKGNEHISKPYISHPYYKFTVSIACPIKVDGAVTGVIMGDIVIE